MNRKHHLIDVHYTQLSRCTINTMIWCTLSTVNSIYRVNYHHCLIRSDLVLILSMLVVRSMPRVFALAIVLSVLLRYTDYPFVIFKFFLPLSVLSASDLCVFNFICFSYRHHNVCIVSIVCYSTYSHTYRSSSCFRGANALSSIDVIWLWDKSLEIKINITRKNYYLK
jgi:hypothetical protein